MPATVAAVYLSRPALVPISGFLHRDDRRSFHAEPPVAAFYDRGPAVPVAQASLPVAASCHPRVDSLPRAQPKGPPVVLIAVR